MKKALANEVIDGKEESGEERAMEADDIEEEFEEVGLEKKNDDLVSLVKEYIPDAVLASITDVVFENFHITGPILGLVFVLFLRWILRWILSPFSSGSHVEHPPRENTEEFAKLSDQIEEMHVEMKLMRQAIEQLTNIMLEAKTSAVGQDFEVPDEVGSLVE